MQVGRSAFVLWALGSASPVNTRNFQRITAWLAFAGLFWIAGGQVQGDARLALWLIALGLDYVAPFLGYRVPGLGRSTTGDWDIEGGHMAERCSLFIIIALGESVLVTGASFGELEWTAVVAAAFLVAFIGSVAMWWIYFDTGAERGSRHIAASSDPGRLARLAYTYIHLLTVGGIIVAAVADELVLAHPGGPIEARAAAAILAGPVLFLLGNTLFKRIIAGRLPLSHLVGLALLAVLALMAARLSPLPLAAAATAVLVLVAAWETVSLSRGREPPAGPET
jgi:low temperature requirement protein LtrA